MNKVLKISKRLRAERQKLCDELKGYQDEVSKLGKSK